MQKLRKWFLISFLCLSGLFLIMILSGFVVMLTPHVTESHGVAAASKTLSQSLPKSAKKVYFCSGSRGLGGRMMLYRFSAPPADLHAHAKAEFAAHWDKPPFKTMQGVSSPFTKSDVEFLENCYGADCSWMLPDPGAVGTIYQSANGRSSHRPLIFVDETNGVLYFEMTD